ncbi:unnamed protein product, partial [Rotaria magnacalcarata]
MQSLKEYTNEPMPNDHGSLDVAYIDETDLERNCSHTKPTCENDQTNATDAPQLDMKNDEIEVTSQTLINEDN